ncbi:MAG: alpha/beta fold hydrolase [Bacillota bacterium]
MKEKLQLKLSDQRHIGVTVYGNMNQNNDIIVFFHGFGSSGSSIHPDINILNELKLCLIAIDRPGVGLSDVHRNYTVHDHCHDVKEVMEHFEVDNYALLGWSAGGLYSQAYASMFPKDVVSLSLVSSAIAISSKESNKYLSNGWKIIRFINKYLPNFTKRHFRKFSKQLNKDIERVLDKSIREMVDADKQIASVSFIRTILREAALEGYGNSGTGVYSDARALCKEVFINKSKMPSEIFIYGKEKKIRFGQLRLQNIFKNNIRMQI